MLDDVPPNDELPTRPAGSWVRDKLAIVGAYLPEFARACRRKAPGWCYVDAFAGPGINRLEDGSLLWGSPMLALGAEPAFATCLLLERSLLLQNALAARTARFGDRAVVRRGDANGDLLGLMAEHIPRKAPCLVFLDPEGVEVDWATLEALSRFKPPGSRFKTELLILFPLESLPRVFPYWSVGDEDESRRFFGNDRWEPIMRRRLANEISAAEARHDYLELYKQGFEQLGYRTVLDRPIYERATWEGRLKYVLGTYPHRTRASAPRVAGPSRLRDRQRRRGAPSWTTSSGKL